MLLFIWQPCSNRNSPMGFGKNSKGIAKNN